MNAHSPIRRLVVIDFSVYIFKGGPEGDNLDCEDLKLDGNFRLFSLQQKKSTVKPWPSWSKGTGSTTFFSNKTRNSPNIHKFVVYFAIFVAFVPVSIGNSLKINFSPAWTTSRIYLSCVINSQAGLKCCNLPPIGRQARLS